MINKMIYFRKQQKIFCIGLNKTGTSSLLKAMIDFQYNVADQPDAEMLIHDYAKRDFRQLLEYCKKYNFFQDIPFSCPFTFTAIDFTFPKSKFILSVRNTGEEWYNSLVKFHSKLFGKNGGVPTYQDLMNANYRYKGFIWDAMSITYNSQPEDPYCKNRLIDVYENHNRMVKEYFRYRPNDLLIINLSVPTSYLQLCGFLDKDPLYDKMPWENKT